MSVDGRSGKLSPVGEGYLLDRWVSGKGDGIRVKSEEIFWKFFIKKIYKSYAFIKSSTRSIIV